jgi:hypothetical protein
LGMVADKCHPTLRRGPAPLNLPSRSWRMNLGKWSC